MAHQCQLMPTVAHRQRQDRRAPTMPTRPRVNDDRVLLRLRMDEEPSRMRYGNLEKTRQDATGRQHPTRQTQESSHRATSTWTRPALKLQEETNIWASSARSSQPATISCQDCC